MSNLLTLRFDTAGRDNDGEHAPMSTQHFNAAIEIQEMRQKRKIRRKKIYTHSSLQKYRVEIIELLKHGASFRMVAEWLRFKKHLKVSHTTVMRFAKKLLECQEVNHA